MSTAIALPPRVGLPLMAKRTAKEPEEEARIPSNFRLLPGIVNRMKAFQRAHPLKPTLTQIIEAAVTDWLDRHESETKQPPPAAGRGR